MTASGTRLNLTTDRSLFFLKGILVLLMAVTADARLLGAPTAQPIRVPYGMAWGDIPDKARQMIAAVKARELSCTDKGTGRQVMEIDGLGVGDPLLRKSLLTFRDGSLTEIEMQYGDASWDSERMTDFFDRTRRRINERYGIGSLIVNKVKEHPSDERIPDDITYTLIVYQWSQPSAVLELDYYAAEQEEKALRMVSLHYKQP